MFTSWSRPARIAVLTSVPLVLASFGIAAAVQRNNGESRVKTRVMIGFQEVPAIMTTGFGDFDAKIDDESIEYTLTYAALEGPVTTQAHIHFGQDGVNGGVSVFLCGGGGKPPCPPVAGTVTGVIVPADIIGPVAQGIEAGNFADLVHALRTGTAYANVHTTRWPGGEIRGQIRDDRDIKDTP
jgi:hypothetical protein